MKRNGGGAMIKIHASALLGLAMVVLIVAPVASYRERFIVSMEAGKCSLTVEVDDESRTMRLRVRPDGENCHIEKASMLEALRAAFTKTESPKLEGTYSSLYIGRLIDYPWLSQYLAVTAHKDPAWDKKKGKPVNLDLYKYVNNLLSQKAVAGEIDMALAARCYKVNAVTVEKVLVGGLREVPLYQGDMAPGKVPYDAMVWFRLKKD
jgi:hypothetical protein